MPRILDLKPFLDSKVAQYNQPGFIKNDPICIPHLFSQKQDIEIMGFWASILAWGQRVTIIKKCKELIELMDGVPHQFITQCDEKDLKRFLHFKHRTFNATDTLYFIEFFRQHYNNHNSLEHAFIPQNKPDGLTVEDSLNHFQTYFFSLPDYPHRTRKHVTSPNNKSTCKRLNMFLRWMARKDDKGVDFGIWDNIEMKNLLCPLDLHVERVARKLGLITRKQVDWQTTLELSENLRLLDPNDPVKYDFALFGLGIEEKF
ncbi:TIGR02757 family protein [Solitalea lacus]|uniref:TIGR02757 family protein n=1 Tax=Solitalea lacus TaxID=2911172 RepID=UPI001EDB9C83|nr:TIGR02757 family protein [Solitalea lacus]UKJ06249.1 TIGR02757 family protein [Solitalea lacus]